MIGAAMPARSPARFLAPLALLASVVALIAVVAGSGTGGSGTPSSSTRTSTPEPPATTGTGSTTPAEAARPAQRVYVVKAGDNLFSISERTGVPVDRIQQLNPDADPQALVAGQRLKLQP